MKYKYVVAYQGYEAAYLVRSFNFQIFRAELTSYKGPSSHAPPKFITFAFNGTSFMGNAEYMALIRQFDLSNHFEKLPDKIIKTKRR